MFFVAVIFLEHNMCKCCVCVLALPTGLTDADMKTQIREIFCNISSGRSSAELYLFVTS